MNKLTNTGTVYVLEGTDGAGKSTQRNILAKKLGCLKGRTPYYECTTGQIVKNYINCKKEGISEETFQKAMLANYIEYFTTVIKPEIEAGRDVVITRGTMSMIAYGSYFKCDLDVLGGLVVAFEKFLLNNGIKTVNILLDLPVNASLKRITARDDETVEIFENKKCLTHVREAYLNVEDIPVVKCEGKSIKQVAKEVEDVVLTYINEL